MANMAYCRFENTYKDLIDCYEALQNSEIESLSESEKKYAIKLIKMCRDVSDEFLDEADDFSDEADDFSDEPFSILK